MERTKKKSLAAQVKSHAKSKEIKDEHIDVNDLVPMGSTLLNLAMSGKKEGGAQKGKMVNIIGGSHGGKSILALTTFAETNMKSSFDEYHFIYDDVERANAFNMSKLFGESTAKRIIDPRSDKEDTMSSTVQHFQANVLFWLKKRIPFIYVLDSFDALDALEDQKKTEEMLKALEKEKETAGTYGMAKAKASSSILRSVVAPLSKSKSCLFIISQIRDNIDPMSPVKETRSGGHALKFYATHEMWLKSIQPIKKQDTVIGNKIKVKVSKSKLTGKVRTVTFDIYYDYGIDDIGSCIDYLIDRERWSGGGKEKINCKGDFDVEPCQRPKLISLIEQNPKHYEKLKSLVEIEWNNFEEGLKLNRKSKYE